jgi:hypothetical protein
VITLLLLLVLSLLGITTIYLSGAFTESANHGRAGTQALFVAEAGVHEGIDRLDLNPSLVQTGFTTQGFGGTEPDIILQGGNGNVEWRPGDPARVSLDVRPNLNGNGDNVECGLQGMSEAFGSPRFQVRSRGEGPGGATREVEAIGLLPPIPDICPPSDVVSGGYAS